MNSFMDEFPGTGWKKEDIKICVPKYLIHRYTRNSFQRRHQVFT